MTKSKLPLTTIVAIIILGFFYNKFQAIIKTNDDLTSTQNIAVYLHKQFISPSNYDGKEDSPLAPLRDWLYDIEGNKLYPVSMSASWLAIYFNITEQCVRSTYNDNNILCRDQLTEEAITNLKTLYSQQKLSQDTISIYYNTIFLMLFDCMTGYEESHITNIDSELFITDGFPTKKIQILLAPPFDKNNNKKLSINVLKNFSTVLLNAMEFERDKLHGHPTDESLSRFETAAAELGKIGETYNNIYLKKYLNLAILMKKRLHAINTGEVAPQTQ